MKKPNTNVYLALLQTSLLSIILGILFVFFLIFWIFYVYPNDYTLSKTAKSISQYPHNNDWVLQYSSGFVNRPSIQICFNSNDNSEKVINYYYDEFIKKGWIPSAIDRAMFANHKLKDEPLKSAEGFKFIAPKSRDGTFTVNDGSKNCKYEIKINGYGNSLI